MIGPIPSKTHKKNHLNVPLKHRREKGAVLAAGPGGAGLGARHILYYCGEGRGTCNSNAHTGHWRGMRAVLIKTRIQKPF